MQRLGDSVRVSVKCLSISCGVVFTLQGGKHLQAFDYVAARTVDEAVSLLAAKGAQARILAGGADLTWQLSGGRRNPESLVDLQKTPGWKLFTHYYQKCLSTGGAVA